MKIIKEGVIYELKNFKNDDTQTIRFVEKQKDGSFVDGTTNEEVINMMIERFYDLQKKRFSIENQVIISLFKGIKQQLKKRLTKKVTLLKNYEVYSSKK